LKHCTKAYEKTIEKEKNILHFNYSTSKRIILLLNQNLSDSNRKKVLQTYFYGATVARIYDWFGCKNKNGFYPKQTIV